MVGIAFYHGWPILFPEAVVNAEPDADCDLHAGDCLIDLAMGGRIAFGIEPRSLPLVAPLRLTVHLQGLEAESVEVDFRGVEMFMGFNRSRLEYIGHGRYQGTGTLPVCLRSRMAWEARVLVHTPSGLVVAPFRFDTEAP